MLIKEHAQYQLDATVTMSGPGHSFALQQRWPQAQNPHWRNILQVTLSPEELRRFGELLLAAADRKSSPEV